MTTTTIYSDADSYISSYGSEDDTNYGTSDHYNIGYQDSTRQAYAEIGFDISSISTPITSCTFYISTTNYSTASGMTFNIYRITDNTWTELGVTFNNQPAVTGTNSAAFAGPGAYSTYVAVNVKAMFEDAIVIGDSFDISIRTTTVNTGNFWSREGTAPPYLYIVYGCNTYNDVYVNSSTGNEAACGATSGTPVQTFGRAYSLLNSGGSIHVLNSGADFSAETVTLNKSFSIDLNGSSGNFYMPKAS